MYFFEDPGFQSRVFDRLGKSLENNKLAHAYLFYGSEGTGKDAAALELAKAINCVNSLKRPCNECASCQKARHINHPDIHLVFPILKSWIPKDIDKEVKTRIALKAQNPFIQINTDPRTVIPIERIRELKNEAKYASYEGGKKIYIISDADKMAREGANALLKLLEEPPDSLILILTTSSLNAMLATIRSRCHLIYFPRLTYKEAESIVARYLPIDDEIKRLIRFSERNLKKIFASFEDTIDPQNRLVYDYMKAIASADILSLHEITEQVTKPRDKNYLMELLNLLILWFKDVIFLNSLGLQAQIVNINYSSELQKFARAYASSDFMQIIIEIEKAISNLNRNVYAPLVLTVLAIKIKQHLIRSE